MKYISFAIPCYNSQDYMAHAIESILPGGEDIEIIIVNDGSKDRTSEIAHEYMEKYPTIIKVVDKENGGHGDAVNSGLMHATGKYFKVVDSDDWVDEDALHKILDVLRHMEEDGMELDMLIANYVYEKVGATHKKVIHYRNVLPQDEIFRWDDMGHFRLDQYILMHSVIYRTDMLKLIQLHLPKHTFYVDNIYVYYPLPHVRKIYYMDVDFYRYFIGREDQSVNEKVMIKRLDQQIFVTKTMIDMYQLKDIGSKKLRQYMLNYLAIMMTVSSILCIRSKDKENLEKKKELWQYLKKKDMRSFIRIRYGILGQTMNIPGKSGRKISSLVYIVARRLIGFNSSSWLTPVHEKDLVSCCGLRFHDEEVVRASEFSKSTRPMCQTRRSAQTVAHIPGNENSGALTTSNHRSIYARNRIPSLSHVVIGQ